MVLNKRKNVVGKEQMRVTSIYSFFTIFSSLQSQFLNVSHTYIINICRCFQFFRNVLKRFLSESHDHQRFFAFGFFTTRITCFSMLSSCCAYIMTVQCFGACYNWILFRGVEFLNEMIYWMFLFWCAVCQNLIFTCLLSDRKKLFLFA